VHSWDCGKSLSCMNWSDVIWAAFISNAHATDSWELVDCRIVDDSSSLIYTKLSFTSSCILVLRSFCHGVFGPQIDAHARCLWRPPNAGLGSVSSCARSPPGFQRQCRQQLIHRSLFDRSNRSASSVNIAKRSETRVKSRNSNLSS